MSISTILNAIRIIVIVSMFIGAMVNYAFIIFDDSAYFEQRVVLFLNLIVTLLVLIFLELI